MSVQLMTTQMVDQFWLEVELSLKEDHNLSNELALRGIVRFRNQTERIGDLIYHNDPVHLARDIVEGGYCKDDYQSRVA